MKRFNPMELITLFITPVLYAGLKEFLLRTGWSDGRTGAAMLGSGLLLVLLALPALLTQPFVTGLLLALGTFLGGVFLFVLLMLVYNVASERRELRRAGGGR